MNIWNNVYDVFRIPCSLWIAIMVWLPKIARARWGVYNIRTLNDGEQTQNN